jgi:CHAT domain-containing protein
MLPSLRERVVSVTPSASTWLRASRAEPPQGRRVALVVGPGLGTGGAEVPQLAERYPGATVLSGATATAERVLAALDGAWLAHIAAHGTFRADNPLFSALHLDDGPMIVHDFERLRRAPYRLVLSSCNSGVSAPVGAEELLGLVSSLVPLGAVGILASVVPVNDLVAVPLMVALHDALRTGATLPAALLSARAGMAEDPVEIATGLSFIALGA